MTLDELEFKFMVRGLHRYPRFKRLLERARAEAKYYGNRKVAISLVGLILGADFVAKLQSKRADSWERGVGQFRFGLRRQRVENRDWRLSRRQEAESRSRIPDGYLRDRELLARRRAAEY